MSAKPFYFQQIKINLIKRDPTLQFMKLNKLNRCKSAKTKRDHTQEPPATPLQRPTLGMQKKTQSFSENYIHRFK